MCLALLHIVNIAGAVVLHIGDCAIRGAGVCIYHQAPQQILNIGAPLRQLAVCSVAVQHLALDGLCLFNRGDLRKTDNGPLLLRAQGCYMQRVLPLRIQIQHLKAAQVVQIVTPQGEFHLPADTVGIV